MEMGHLKRVFIEGSATTPKLRDAVLAHPEDNVVFELEETRSVSNYEITGPLWRKAMKKAMKNKAWQKKFPGPEFDETKINVVLHLRRGDMVRKPKAAVLKKRYTGNQFYISVLASIKKLFPKGMVVGHFISQGDDPKEFEDIQQAFPKDNIFLNSPVFLDFRRMIEADVLVTAKSGFSHLAAALSDKMIVALPFWSSYSYLSSVVYADEENSDGFTLDEFADVWNKRPLTERKGLLFPSFLFSFSSKD